MDDNPSPIKQCEAKENLLKHVFLMKVLIYNISYQKLIITTKFVEDIREQLDNFYCNYC